MLLQCPIIDRPAAQHVDGVDFVYRDRLTSVRYSQLLYLPFRVNVQLVG